MDVAQEEHRMSLRQECYGDESVISRSETVQNENGPNPNDRCVGDSIAMLNSDNRDNIFRPMVTFTAQGPNSQTNNESDKENRADIECMRPSDISDFGHLRDHFFPERPVNHELFGRGRHFNSCPTYEIRCGDQSPAPPADYPGQHANG